jgi:CheY-like chemotaxis protein
LSRAQRILLADDEAGIRELTREFLEGEGFQVLAVADGQEALDAFHSDPRAWDLLILDLVMPKLGGAEVLSRIEQIRPDLPALMISGYSAEVRPDLLDGSHRGFLAKPFRLHELLKAIQLLELKSPLRGAPLG